MYEIFALRYAERTNRTRAESFKYSDDHDAPMPIDFYVSVVRNDSRTIVVDTGFGPAEAKRRVCENFACRSPFPVCYSEADTLASYARLEQLADSEDHVIPGHDPLVRAPYAAPTSELEVWVCRLDEPPARTLASMGLLPR